MSKAEETKTIAKAEAAVSRYSKQQLIAAKRFVAADKDILAVTLDNNTTYTLDEAKLAVQAFKDKEVK
ncbi:hypothetical protein M3629_03840 [Paenibacillus polysaccharolyticus]|uniref:hypothetical protein n=1 Tax=Paenibacillus polysaccharolyticus TaxID=582692 RepID=UPI00203DB56D|nr:hypothetical protein [Paenibacillus polysaccharolyticus]MCM3131900.1 hypothetical protein [Paenibacillus polysaccharolyticus]